MKVARRRIVAMGSQAATAANRKFHTSHDCQVSCAPQRGVLRRNRIPTSVSGKPAVSLPTTQIRFRSPRRNDSSGSAGLRVGIFTGTPVADSLDAPEGMLARVRCDPDAAARERQLMAVHSHPSVGSERPLSSLHRRSNALDRSECRARWKAGGKPKARPRSSNAAARICRAIKAVVASACRAPACPPPPESRGGALCSNCDTTCSSRSCRSDGLAVLKTHEWRLAP